MIRKLSMFTMLLFVSAVLNAAPRRRAVRFPPSFPACSMITGTPAVTFTRDHGATLAPTAECLSGIGYTYGLAALDTPGTLLAWHKADMIISTDHGCSWRVLATFTDYDFPPRLVAAKGGRAYAWSDNRSFLVRYDSRGAVKLKQPTAFAGLAVDPNNADHLRAGGDDGAIYDSHDGGETWQRAGVLNPGTPAVIIYRFTFDPGNIDHVVAGTAVNGAYVSFDAGRTWRQSTGVGRGATNVFELAISPADGKVIWAEGIDVSESLRHIWRSTDGGETFSVVVDQSATVHLINGTLMAAHPTDPNILYFVFGTYFQGYGTDLYRYDAASRSLNITHNDSDDINSMAFSALRPNLMYLGLESESGAR